MSKRRRKDNIYKNHQSNLDGYNNIEDYTADCETYDFVNDGKSDEIEFNTQMKKSSNYQDSCEDLKSDFSQLLNDNEEPNSEYVCRDFIRNICRRGRKCKFKHPVSVKRSWPIKNDTTNNSGQFEVNFCHDYQNHGCNRPQCRFIHCNRPEQEFYYATGILLSSVFCNNIQVPYCKDYLSNSCTRIKCKFLHLTKEEIEQQNKSQEVINQTTDYTNYPLQSSIEQSVIQPLPGTNANFYSSFHDHYPSSQQMNVMPSQTISIGNSLPLTNAQFTVSLPLGSVSYSTSQQQLIAQPSLTNVQYIHDPILSSVAHEVGSINSDVLSQLPASNQHNMGSQMHPQQQQVVYSSIIHNPGVSLPQHHAIQPQFTLISSDNQNHSQLLSAPLPVGSSNTSAHIINPVAVAQHNPSQNQQYTISQQPPVGVSIFSVATPCSLLSASPTTAEVMHTFQQQQMRSFDQKDQTCIVQKSILPNTNLDITVNDNNHINSTLTPIYIQHNLPSAVPVTQYRVTALETTTTPGLVIHNTLDPNNLQLLQTTNTSNNPSDRIITSSNISFDHKPKFNHMKTSPEKDQTDQYFQIIKENEKLKRKLLDLQKQTNDLQTANELLLDQNARLRNFKTCCNGSGNNNPLESKSNSSDVEDRGYLTHNPMFTTIHNSSNPSSNQSLISKQNELVSNPLSEMATITLTVPIGIPLSNSSIDHSPTGSNSMASHSSNELSVNKIKLPSAEISYSLSNNDESVYKSVCTTTECSDYISPTLVSSALRSIQKSVMPTLHALVASSNVIKTEDYTLKQPQQHQLKIDNGLINPNESENIEIPMRSSSCPVTCTYKSIPDQTIKCHESTSSNKVCCLRLSNFSQTPQLCFQ